MNIKHEHIESEPNNLPKREDQPTEGASTFLSRMFPDTVIETNMVSSLMRKNAIGLFVKAENETMRELEAPQPNEQELKIENQANLFCSDGLNGLEQNVIRPVQQESSTNPDKMILRSVGILGRFQPNLSLPEIEQLEVAQHTHIYQFLSELLTKLVSIRVESAETTKLIGNQIHTVSVEAMQLTQPFKGFQLLLQVYNVFGELLLSIPSDTIESEKKFFHNMDKNVMEHLTTHKYLKMDSARLTTKQMKILRELHHGARLKHRMRDEEKQQLWTEIQDQVAWIELYFKTHITSESFECYILDAYVRTKIKYLIKTESSIRKVLAEMAFTNRNSITEFALSEKLNATTFNIGHKLGSYFHDLMISKLVQNWQKFIDDTKFAKSFLEGVLIESTIHKALWMIIQRDKIWTLMQERLKTRLIMMHQTKIFNFGPPRTTRNQTTRKGIQLKNEKQDWPFEKKVKLESS